VTVTRSVVLGCGAYLPATVVTNEDLAKRVDTSDECPPRAAARRQHEGGEPMMRTASLAIAAGAAAVLAGVGYLSLASLARSTETPLAERVINIA